MVIPTRTSTQRLDALAKANRVRTYRSLLKTSLKAGADIAAVLQRPAPEVHTMHVAALLNAQWAWGPAKTKLFMRRHAISDRKTVGGLSKRQRRELCAALRLLKGEPT